MTQEEKQLLLKDLCARLPYRVKVCIDKEGYEVGRLNCIERFVDEKSGECWCGTIGIYRGVDLKRIKPYLRPMSSMTGEEWCEYCDACLEDEKSWTMANRGQLKFVPITNREDYLNSHHFDYRGLIDKGLAIEAPEDMYKND